MKKTAIVLMFITILSKIIGFLREIVLAYYFGASNISDAYLIALTIPGVIFAFVGVGISTGFIPLYSKIIKAEGIEAGNSYINNIINLILVISTVIIFLTLLFTKEIVKAFAVGFYGDTLKTAVIFTRIFIVGIYFSGIIHIFTGFLQIKNKFMVPALLGIPFNLITILAIVLGAKSNTHILIIGTLIAKIIELLLLIPYVYKNGFRYSFILDIKNQHLKQMLVLALPVIIGTSVNQINILVDRTLASSISIGGISALNYANRLNLFVQGIFVMSIATVMYPMISKMAAENNLSGLKGSVSEAVGSVNLLVIPVTIGSMIFAEPIVKLLFGRGAFNSQAVHMTSVALLFYSIGMIGYGLREVISKAFYSLQDTKTPMINAAVALMMNITLNIILSRVMGIGGLALATSISAIFCTVLLFINLRRKIGAFGMKKMASSFVKICAASIIMGAAAKGCYSLLAGRISVNISLVLSIGLGAIIYFILVYLMKVEEVNDILMIIKRKLKRSSEYKPEQNISA